MVEEFLDLVDHGFEFLSVAGGEVYVLDASLFGVVDDSFEAGCAFLFQVVDVVADLPEVGFFHACGFFDFVDDFALPVHPVHHNGSIYGDFVVLAGIGGFCDESSEFNQFVACFQC